MRRVLYSLVKLQNISIHITMHLFFRCQIYCAKIRLTVIFLLKVHPLIKAPPMVSGPTILSKVTKIGLISLMIDRFSIRNHRWKAQILSFYPMSSGWTLLSRPVPLLGIIRYEICTYEMVAHNMLSVSGSLFRESVANGNNSMRQWKSFDAPPATVL